MTHVAGNWCGPRLIASPAGPLSHLEATNLQDLLNIDASSYLYSSLLSIADACHAINSGFYSWATTKLYYSVFYSFRAMLALRGLFIFYLDEKPKLIDARPGEIFRKPTNSEGKGGTHGLVLTMFTNRLPNHILLSQPIGGISAPKWMKTRREEVNYGRAKYYEPNTPEWMSKIAEAGVRRTINAYIDDDLYLYAFDPDHAALSYPITAAKHLIHELKLQNVSLGEDDAHFLSQQITDPAGQISEWSRLVHGR